MKFETIKTLRDLCIGFFEEHNSRSIYPIKDFIIDLGVMASFRESDNSDVILALHEYHSDMVLVNKKSKEYFKFRKILGYEKIYYYNVSDKSVREITIDECEKIMDNI